MVARDKKSISMRHNEMPTGTLIGTIPYHTVWYVCQHQTEESIASLIFSCARPRHHPSIKSMVGMVWYHTTYVYIYHEQ